METGTGNGTGSNCRMSCMTETFWLKLKFLSSFNSNNMTGLMMTYRSLAHPLRCRSRPFRRSATWRTRTEQGSHCRWTLMADISSQLDKRWVRIRRVTVKYRLNFTKQDLFMTVSCVTHCRWQGARRFHLRSRPSRHTPSGLWCISCYHTETAARYMQQHLQHIRWSNIKGPVCHFPTLCCF